MAEKSTKFKVSVTDRHFTCEVAIPKELGKEFQDAFGQKFPRLGAPSGSTLRPVETYREFIDQEIIVWAYTVMVLRSAETRFYEFLTKFCQEYNLEFIQPEIKES